MQTGCDTPVGAVPSLESATPSDVSLVPQWRLASYAESQTPQPSAARIAARIPIDPWLGELRNLPPIDDSSSDPGSVDGEIASMPILVLLPPIDDGPETKVGEEIEAEISRPSMPDTELSAELSVKLSADEEPPRLGILLPPESVDEVLETFSEMPEQELAENTIYDTPSESSSSDLSPEELLLLQSVINDVSASSTTEVTNTRLDEMARSKIQRGYALANRRAYYSARRELIEVLRMISHAQDAQRGAPEQMVALAAGLRALDEAEDFAPNGTQLEAQLNLEIITAAHQTPIANQIDLAGRVPQQMIKLYLRYAQLKLAAAVTGEPSGSMALHALGKLNSQLGKEEPGRHPLAHRRAIAFQQAALLAHNQNHLAAHELAVLLAGSGHLVEAERLLSLVATREPNAIVYRNLAHVQQKMGNLPRAAASRAVAERLARQGASGNNHVDWLSPQQFARSTNTIPQQATIPSRTGRPANF